TSYIMKTTRHTVDYIRIIAGQQQKATINLDIDVKSNHFNDHNSSPTKLLPSFIQQYLSQVVKPLTVGNIRGTLNMLKFTLAVGVELMATKLASFSQPSSRTH
ncbi:hypothetical protein MUP77_11540, partial [Candidatus Bathyarchaeota archaeon]|nr:hypothetical protein [Candidatus Bathyarchaeota archaeon]